MTESSRINTSGANLVCQSSAHPTPTRLVLIDGNAILHRAYHALPPLTSPKGTLVNAVYGFTSMLLRLVHDFTPSHVAVCFDRPKPTFRKELYKDYQAKRPEMDKELSGQIGIVHDLLLSFGVPIFEMDGYEADDILGTLCRKISNSKFQIPNKTQKLKSQKNETIDQIIIVTGDKDILQLVEDDKVLVYMPTKGLSEAKLYGEKETKERLGVLPNRIADFKALAGDASDNYPGIPGVGPKTAVEILTKAGSVTALYKKIGKTTFGLSDALVKKIKEGKESAMLSYELATIKQDVPIAIDIPEMTKDQFQTPEAVSKLQELGFSSLVKRVKGEEKQETKRQGDLPRRQAGNETKRQREKKTEQLALV